MVEEIEVYDNKYKIVVGTDNNGKFVNRILRNDEPYVEEISSIKYGRVIIAMFYEILNLKEKLKER